MIYYKVYLNNFFVKEFTTKTEMEDFAKFLRQHNPYAKITIITKILRYPAKE